jgi:hypothetical protein
VRRTTIPIAPRKVLAHLITRPAACCAAAGSLTTTGTFDMRTRYSTPGIPSLSSANAAVRSNDGICAVHDRYVAATSVCAAYAAAADLREAQSASTSTRQS